MNLVLPDDAQVGDLLKIMYGDDLAVESGSAIDPAQSYVAIYIDDADAPIAACFCDKAFAAYSSAALTMLPAGAAKEVADGGDMSQAMVDNLHEVMNICSRFFMNDRTPHLRLDTVSPPAADGRIDQLLGAGGRGDFKIAIPRYGEGTLAVLAT